MVNIPSFIDRLLSVNDTSNPSLTRCINEADIDVVIEKCTKILLAQATMVEVQAPIAVCGDIHGQYTDLLRIFNRCSFPPDQNYLFLGDYVDRGRQQLEVICLLMAYKIRYPNRFFILRGNHECASINRTYGFYDECKRRYSLALYNDFQNLFNHLPLCAMISGRIFCMHGGLSQKLVSWTQLAEITRPFDPPNNSLAMDLLWADPENNMTGWAESSRGVSQIFGADVVKDFTEKMNIDLIARGHQVVQDGYEFFADKRLVTIFSAPKYCGEFDNNAAVMIVDERLIVSFEILKPAIREVKIQARGAAAAKNMSTRSILVSSRGPKSKKG
ncbi:Serine/threonine-protein phosphatase [Caenorhabditis elegans]|uniref:Serine/threonine-protein phosphatase n=1 Tax=Caenorhabditis elegans TaxID=6239 RepID=Q27501_CAEEL|nr:Serine/threonine-protein phosphatase [Caenorhabditis elegans]CAA91326.1 Serine/threonine-protein phosphatase [Caenorhabditis elegans]|eukprot:NP_496167.1 Serine/threonine-protein phosphatase [Caenorhabditis elegans]